MKGCFNVNETIKTQLNHRSIRQFTTEKITDSTIDLLVDVARHTATSNFLQAYSIICLESKEKKEKLAKICNQPYVAQASHIFIFIADQYRNQQIAKEHHQDTAILHNMERYMSASTDAILAAQNVNLAAESMGLGTVFLGSILNDNQAVIDLLDLPELTFAVLGLAMGYPDQEPQLKPRLKKDVMFHKETYKRFDNYTKELVDYDASVTEYYDLRDTSKRVDSFTNQVSQSMNRKPLKRMRAKEDIESQGFMTK